MKRQDQDAPPSAAAPKRRKSRGRRKSKAERLARSAPVNSSPDNLNKLLQGSSSREWDAAQSLALGLTLEARATVVRVILKEREAPRAAAHYAKRLDLRGEELLSSVTSGSEISPLVMAQFLVELDEQSLSTREKLQRFVWPWLLQSTEQREDKAVVKAAVHLMLLPTASDDTKVQDKKERGLRMQRAVVTQCLQTGKLLHLVPTHARSFVDHMKIASSGAELDDEKEDEAMEKELQRRQQVARRVQNVLRLLWPDARVPLFGSSVTRLLELPEDEEGVAADVDMCALLPSAAQFRQDTAPLVTEVKEHLTLYFLPDSTDEKEHVTAVTRARVPIVNFRDPSSNLPCDLCVNNLPALWNTRLLRRLLYGGASIGSTEQTQLEHVRKLCKWLRKWRHAKKRVVGGAVSSYGLMLLALYYLQRISVLPVLDCSAHVVEDESSLRELTESAIDERLEAVDKSFVCVEEHAKRAVQDWRALRCGFFRFYTCEFGYELTVVSLRTKEVVTKASKGWSRQNNARLCLEDPVEIERDLGKLCSRLALGRLRCAFAHACVVLSRKDEEQGTESVKNDIEADLLAAWPYEDDNTPEETEDATVGSALQMTVAKGDSSASFNRSGALHGLGNQSSAREAREAERRIKLQHFLVLRAFNLRRPKETLHEQFQSLRKRVERSDPKQCGDFLELDELCAYLSIPPYRRLLLVQVFGLGPKETQLGFDDFVRFLQSAAVRAAQEERQRHEGGLPTPPPRPSRSQQLSEALVAFDPARAHHAVARAPPAPGLWKKREVTIQERITEYTKIDEKGQPQRLVEKERHQTEVLHMESLDGEFAHREITQFEQTEHLNDEMVHLDHGREEFLHLKSRHDEISRFESSVPPGGPGGGGRPEECEQQPPSPSIKPAPGSARESTGFENTQAEAQTAAYAECWEQQEDAPHA
ncbi:hypothetical protein PHYSODRAFT_516032 [Phytophthora sojae]|uniref:Uncharacterized protein n=1 Tax=Phytophthora sojae (strain P6497) TaxID=1094619 RepID=G4ZWL6_PHYSP|nr:hypothetical protein PHYSODRAFT_516032 [Phytophthora sojae]EGZ11690.1 hypothetical protein PHYSODRAFT_516032 [Phytophthora sojae]|eukprot:XP_009532023.1 hypothetical protein PHYSODRAFT_516032 [Phytophthora sojae]